MKKQIAAAVLLLVALGTVASFGAYQAGVFDNDPVQAQAADPKPGADKEEKKEEAAPPKGEKTDDGLEYKIPFERGEGSVKFARQNEMLRVDYDVRLPYSAGDGQGARGSSIDLMLSVDGIHGRHLFFFPNPLWLPNPQNTLSAYRFEASYSKDTDAPTRLDTDPTFVGDSNVTYWDHWTATMWVDLRLMIIPGNTPTSLADSWYAGLVVGNQAATVVFPSGMDMYNPAKTPDSMMNFKFSELPELEEIDDSPFDTFTEQEDAMHEAQRTIIAKLRVRDTKGAWGEIKSSAEKWPSALWGLYLRWLASAQGLAESQDDVLKFEKEYVNAGLGQSSAHIQYLFDLLADGNTEGAKKHADSIFKSGLCTGRAETDGYMRLQWAQRCTMWGEVAEAQAQQDYITEHKELLEDNNFRIDFNFQRASLAIRKGESAEAVKIYEAMLKDERKVLDAKQFNQIQHALQFQRQAVEQWEEEQKFQKEDADKTNPRLVIETAKGKIVVELFEDDAPNTTAALVKLAKDEFWDGLNFHRVEPNFVAQGGDPNGDGSGSPGWRLKSEISRRNHFRGTFAMARSQDPNSQGCQFYVCLSNNESVLSLSGKYVVAGRVIEGMDRRMIDVDRTGKGQHDQHHKNAQG